MGPLGVNARSPHSIGDPTLQVLHTIAHVARGLLDICGAETLRTPTAKGTVGNAQMLGSLLRREQRSEVANFVSFRELFV